MLPIMEMLTDEDQFDLGRRKVAGDDEARQELIVRFRPLVLFWIGRFKAYALDTEELEGISYKALVRAGNHWKPDRGTTFKTYASAVIKRALVWHLFGRPGKGRSMRKLNGDGTPSRSVASIPLSSMGAESRRPIDDSGIMRDERRDDAHTLLAKGDDARRIREAVARLDRRLQVVLSLRVGLDGDERTLEEVGAVLGISKERARQLERRGVYLLAREMGCERPAETLMGNPWGDVRQYERTHNQRFRRVKA